MSYYKVCPICGAHLDPGESCDCPASKFDCLSDENKRTVADSIDALIAEQNRTAADAANIDDGKVEQTLTGPVSPRMIHENT